MASNPSFDVSTGADLQEVDNAINQAQKEIAQRYDFKGTNVTIEFDRVKGEIKLAADDEFRMKQVVDVISGKFAKRAVPLQNVGWGEDEGASGMSVRRTVILKQALDSETSKKITKAIKDQGFKKVQASIQGDEVRVSSPSKDELQAVMAFLRTADVGVALKFGNFRS
jgi:uncharacterized protein YajQ (UPF0234 family)